MEDVIWQRELSSQRRSSEEFYVDIDLENRNRNNNGVLIVDVDDDQIPVSPCQRVLDSCIERLNWKRVNEEKKLSESSLINDDLKVTTMSLKRALTLNDREKRELVGNLPPFEAANDLSEEEIKKVSLAFASSARSSLVLDEAMRDLGVCPSQISSCWSTISDIDCSSSSSENIIK